MTLYMSNYLVDLILPSVLDIRKAFLMLSTKLLSHITNSNHLKVADTFIVSCFNFFAGPMIFFSDCALFIQLVLSRKMSFYIVTYYLPSGLFVVVSWISFLVNPEVILKIFGQR